MVIGISTRSPELCGTCLEGKFSFFHGLGAKRTGASGSHLSMMTEDFTWCWVDTGTWRETRLWRQGLGPWSLSCLMTDSPQPFPYWFPWTSKISFYLNSTELNVLQLTNNSFYPTVSTSVAWAPEQEHHCSSFLLKSDVSPSSKVLVSTK